MRRSDGKADPRALCDLIEEQASQGKLTIQKMCMLAGISRTGYYRHPSANPRRLDTLLRDRIQSIATLKNRNYGYRRIQVVLQKEGWIINHKRVLRLMRDDNLLCLRRKAFVPVTTNSKHEWRRL